jgi:antitoxin HicB
MNSRGKRNKTDHSGSTFDRFLEQEGIREEVEAVAIKRVLVWQFERAMREQQKTKQAMAGNFARVGRNWTVCSILGTSP